MTNTDTGQRTAPSVISLETTARLPSPPAIDPLRVERKGQTFAVVALTDIDGTIVDELLPEKERLSSIVPALEPAKILERTHSIPIGIITGRSYGEAKLYREKLGGSGPIICENGALISIPGILPEAAAAARERGFAAYQLPGELLIVPTRVRPDDLLSALERIEQEWAKKGNGDAAPRTTSLSPVQNLAECLKFATLEDAARAAERVASIFVTMRSPEERAFFEDSLKDTALTLAGHDLPHILPRDCDKGSALRVLTELLSVAFPRNHGIDGVVPIIFGNGANDIPSLQTAEKLGGKGVLVARTGGGYAVDPAELPPSLILSSRAAGHGIAEVLPRVMDWLYQQYHAAAL